MKLPKFIYTRRWFVIIGLAVTLACLTGVLVYLNFQSGKNQVVANDKESTSSAQEATESAEQDENQAVGEIAQGEPANEQQTASAKAAMLEVKTALESKDGPRLYGLLSKEMKEIFTEESVVQAFAQAEGLKVTPIEEIKLNSEWAKQDVEATDASGDKRKFRVVLHLEDGQWKLFGTENIS